MKKNDFEKYALNVPMNGNVATNWQKIFNENILEQLFNKNKIPEDIKVLDYGCGDGKYFDFFSNFFKVENIYGVEVSKLRVENCKKRGWNKVFFLRNKEKLPFEDEYFDFINCDQVIEHIYKKDIDFYLEEIRRVLKKEGVAFFVTPNYPIKRLYDLKSVLRSGNFKKIFDDSTHVNFYSFKSVKKEMGKFFNNIKLIPTGGIFFDLFKKNFFSHKIFIITNK